ncbi:MAG: isochorismatase family protein [Draconibacterium sp.]|nr:isochorismatase family protein [Draconibacterium sp.]
MNLSDLLFWNVDTQKDFVLPSGKLYVQDAELLKPKWEKITQFAKENSIRVVNTADYHYSGSAELSSTPNFVNTFPSHCMANTKGAEYITETTPENPVIFNWDNNYRNFIELLDAEKSRNIVIRKDAFDVFKGNKITESIVKYLSPKTVVVYGVTTNVCVNDAVVGLSSRGVNVFVIGDAIKELPNIPLPFDNWNKLGVKIIQLNELEKLLMTIIKL